MMGALQIMVMCGSILALAACASAKDIAWKKIPTHFRQQLMNSRPTVTVDRQPEYSEYAVRLEENSEAENGTNLFCENKGLELVDETVLIGGNYEGLSEDAFYVDTSFDFYRYAMGWVGRERHEEERMHVLEYFKLQFGLDASDAELDGTSGKYFSKTSSLTYYQIVSNVPTSVLARYSTVTSCKNANVILGGWVMHGSDLAYGGRFGALSGGEITIKGDSTVFAGNVVVYPSDMPTKFAVRTTSPVSCFAGVCPLRGDLSASMGTLLDRVSGAFNGAASFRRGDVDMMKSSFRAALTTYAV